MVLFNIYCFNYLMKIDRIHVYDCAITRLRHGLPTNAQREFSPRSQSRLQAFMERGLNLHLHLSESHVLTSSPD